MRRRTSPSTSAVVAHQPAASAVDSMFDAQLMAAACGHLSLKGVESVLEHAGASQEPWTDVVRNDPITWTHAECMITCWTTPSELDHIRQRVPLLQRLILRGPQPISIKWWRALGRFVHLRQLSIERLLVWPKYTTILRAMRPTKASVTSNSNSDFLPRLQRLSMRGCRNLEVGWLTALLILPMTDEDLTGDHSMVMVRPRFPLLDDLDLSDCTDLTPHVWILLHALSATLRHINLSGTSDAVWRPFSGRDTPARMLTALCRDMTQVETLVAARCSGLTDHVLASWNEIEHQLFERDVTGRACFPSLRRLCVDSCEQLTSGALLSIAEHINWSGQLEVVSARDNPDMAFAGIDWFASNSYRRSMRVLQLGHGDGISRRRSGVDTHERQREEWLEKSIGDGAMDQFLEIVGPGLETLTLHGCMFTQAFERAQHLASCVNLTSLSLTHHLGVTVEMVHQIARMPLLTRLSLAGCRNVDAVALAQLARAEILTDLDLSDCVALDDTALTSIVLHQTGITPSSQSRHVRTHYSPWRRLLIDRCPLVTSNCVAHLLRQPAVTTCLEELGLSGCTAASDATCLAAVVSHAPTLVISRLCCTHLKSDDVYDLPLQARVAWTVLELDGWSLSGTTSNQEAWKRLLVAPSLKHMVVVFNEQTIVEREALISSLSRVPLLTRLDVSSRTSNIASHWGDEHLDKLLRALPHLEKLHLYQPNRFTVAALYSLAELAPCLHVLACAHTPVLKQYFHSDSCRLIPTADSLVQRALLQRLTWLDWDQSHVGNETHLAYALQHTSSNEPIR